MDFDLNSAAPIGSTAASPMSPPPAEKTNVFDLASARPIGTPSAAQTLQQAQGVAVANSTTSASTAGQAAQVGRQIGAPQAAVETDLPRYQAQAKAQQNAQILADSPKLAGWVANNPDAARVAQDDFLNMSKLEKQFASDAAPRSTAFLNNIIGGFNDASLAVNRLLGYGAQGVDAVAGTHASDWWYNNMIAPGLHIKAATTTAPDAPFGVKGAAVLGNLLSMVAQIAATGGGSAVAEGGVAANTVGQAVLQSTKVGARSMAFPSLTSAVNTGQDVYDQTGDMKQAIRASQMSYLTTTLGGIVPLGVPGKLGARLATGAASGMVTGEVSRQAMNMVMPQSQDFDPEQTILSGLSGAMLGGVMGHSPLHEGVQKTFNDGINAEIAERGGQAIEQLSQLAQTSKLRENDPEAFKAFVRTATEDGNMPNVYVDGKTFADALHQSTVDPTQIPGLSDRLNEALQTGGDVQIPVEDYATHIAGTDLDKTILPNLKAEEGGMTYAEGQKFYQDTATDMQARAQDIVAQHTQEQAQQDDVKAIGDKLFDQMKATGRFPDDVAKASIAPVSEFYRTMADRAGMTPGELYEKYPLKVAAASEGENDLHQAARTSIKDALDKAQADKRYTASHDIMNAAPEAVKEAAAHGLDIDGFKHVIDGSAIRHVLKQHGNEQMEIARGNLPVTSADFNTIPDILANPDRTIYGMKNDIGRDTIGYLKKMPDGSTLYMEEVRTGKKTLAMQSMRRYPPTTNVTSIEKSLRHNVRNASEDAFSVVKHPKERNTDKLEQGERGAFSPDSNTIALMKDADLSTFLHESGHFFLNTLGDLANRPDAPQQIRDDMDTAIKWMGGKDLADWNSRTLEQQRDMHEKFARGFESYLMEGKAPTQEMQPLFSRFRAWLMNVYKNVSSLGAELTPEVRSVMDRMIASDDAIKQAEQSRGYFPLDLSKSGATEKEQADYAALGQQATQDAVSDMQSKSMQDMKWASNAKSKALKALQRQALEARRGVQAEVTKEVMAEPINRAREFLKTGETVDPATGDQIKIDKGFKLNTDAIKDMYPEGMLARPDLDKLRGMTTPDGLHPDQVAEIFGFSSGDQLVRSLTDGEQPKEAISRLTDERMLQRHGELTDPDAMDNAANAAIHNETRAKFMATGLKLLTKSKIPARELARAATEAANKAIAAKRVGDLNPRQYEVAEAKANKEAILQAPKDPAAAIEAQRQALLSNRLAAVTRDAVAEVKKIVKSQARYDKDTIRAKMDPDVLDQIDALRERFDFRKVPSSEPAKQEVQLQTWMESQQALGYAPLQNADMLNPAVRMHYDDMTVEQLRGFHDTIRSMETIARERKMVTIDGKKVDLAQVVGDLVDKMKARGEKFTTEDLVDKPRKGVDPLISVGLDRAASFIRASAAELKPQQFKANQYDMHEVMGPFSKTIFERVFHANYDKLDMLKGLSNDFKTAGDKLGLEWQKSLTDTVTNTKLLDADLTKEAGKPIYRRLTRGDMLGIARHVGNESNFDKLTKGMEWNPVDVWSFLHENMTAKDWEATQNIWDAFEKHWPAMVEMNRRLGNTSPDRIEPRPFSTTFGDLKGGYAPVDYDSLRSRLAVRKSDASAIDPSEGLFGKGYFRADTTTNGSLNSRVANYYDRLDLDFHSVERRLHDTVHDLAYREALLDTHKILTDKDFRRQFNLSFGPEAYKSMQNWVGDLANGQNRDQQLSKLGTILSSSRRAIVANGIALRISTTLKHGGSAGLKSLGYFSGGGEKYFAARVAAIGLHHTEEIQGAMQKFPEIRARLMRQDRDFRQMSASMFQPEGLHAKAERFGHSMVAWSDMMSAVPTAWAAYDRAITEGLPANRGGTGKPMSEADAVAYANQIVREAHGSNIESSRSMILQNKDEVVKMLTTLYGFMNNTLGQNMDMLDKLKTSGFSKPEVLSRYMMAMIVPALWAGALAKHDSEESWLKWAAGSIAGEYAGMVPMVRDAWSMVEGYHSAGLPAYMSALGAIAKPAEDAYKVATGGEVKAPIKDAGNAIGLMIPGAGQIGTSLQYAADVHGGNEQPNGPVDVARGLALGQSNK